MSSGNFVPFGGEMVEKGAAPQFIGHGNAVPDPAEPPDPVAETPPVVPAKANDPTEAVRTVLTGLTGEIPEDTINQAVQQILQTVEAGPTRLALPDLKLQPSETPPLEPVEGEEPAQTHPELSLEKDGDKVTRIKVDCICGETIVMDCDY
ncbi:MAG: hypothetical protein QF685_00050 [Verrucomicrobiota bacterium]|jgi:hypothetical protein|nr:hypothetical protein [Verrucomicrobiota bacterium]